MQVSKFDISDINITYALLANVKNKHHTMKTQNCIVILVSYLKDILQLCHLTSCHMRLIPFGQNVLSIKTRLGSQEPFAHKFHSCT